MTKVWLNGLLVDAAKARISIFDRAFMYGDGAFETMRAYSGKIFMLEAHVARLFKALAILRIKPAYGKDALKKAAAGCLKANKLSDAYIRIAVTAGEGRFGIGYKDDLTPNAVIVAKKFDAYPAWMHEKGLRVRISPIRQNGLSPLSRIKSLNFLNYILARRYAQEEGFDEAVLLNTKGCVAEAATSNIFIVKKDGLVTPPVSDGILPGVTRAVVLKIAARIGLKTSERSMRPQELLSADEVFLTNSLTEILPVRKVNSRRIGIGLPGPVTRLLHTSYRLTCSNIYSNLVI